MDMHTIEVLLETVFSTRSMQRGDKEDNWGNQHNSVWEAVKKKKNWKRVGREPSFREGLRAEAQEFPLLEAVTSERLEKA
jgi:hypothetical protein